MIGASERASSAAWKAAWSTEVLTQPNTAALIRAALNAAHDPALGLDRSVCLRDVVEAIRRSDALFAGDAADPLEREFGGERLSELADRLDPPELSSLSAAREAHDRFVDRMNAATEEFERALGTARPCTCPPNGGCTKSCDRDVAAAKGGGCG